MNKQNKLKIAFISPKRYSFYPRDYLERGLGGTESSLVLLSKSLANIGHTVHVYNCCYKPGVYKGVHWKPVWELDDSEERYDVCVSLRLLETFDSFKIKSPLRAVWIHDDSLKGATKYDKTGKVNLWIAVSETQKQYIEVAENIQKENWFVSRNAYDEDLYGKKDIDKKPGQLIYCSAPDRGLVHLLHYWDEIRSRAQNVSLHVTGSFALWGNADEENYRFFSDLYNLNSNLEDVTFHGRLNKKDLAELQAESVLMAYPTTFDEMYCISALECMSVGTPVISTERAAMIERVLDCSNGYLIKGHPSELEYREAFISKIVSLVNDIDQLDKIASEARKSVSGLDFLSLAREWELEFNSRLNQKNT